MHARMHFRASHPSPVPPLPRLRFLHGALPAPLCTALLAIPHAVCLLLSLSCFSAHLYPQGCSAALLQTRPNVALGLRCGNHSVRCAVRCAVRSRAPHHVSHVRSGPSPSRRWVVLGMHAQRSRHAHTASATLAFPYVGMHASVRGAGGRRWSRAYLFRSLFGFPLDSAAVGWFASLSRYRTY